MAHLPYSTLAEIENKHRESTRSEYVVALADALKVSVRELLTGERATDEAAPRGETLAPRETALLAAFRASNSREKQRIEDFVAGLATPGRKTKKSDARPPAQAEPSVADVKRRSG